jgi:hypothetical protein
MFLHLSHDEKFIDSAHAAFEAAASGEHVFVAVDAIGPLKYIKTFEPRRMRLEALLDPAFLACLPAYDAVFLHSLNKPNRLIVDAAPPDTQFVWIGWGYDYYRLICEQSALLLPRTRALMQRVRSESAVGSLAALAKAALLSPGRLRSGLRLRRIGPGGADAYAMLQKIAFFAPVLPTEDALVRERHPDFLPRRADWNYGVHDIIDALTATTAERMHRVVVGNSATPECNHIEAFEALAGFDGEIVVPLSYGNAAYRDAILQAGRDRWGDRFQPLTDYMASDAYARLIAGSTHLVMNHLRQQGLTNILIALQAGTRVVMRKENPLFPYLAELGLPADDITRSLAEAPLADAVVTAHREKVSRQFGAAHHHRRTCAFLGQVRRARELACTP